MKRFKGFRIEGGKENVGGQQEKSWGCDSGHREFFTGFPLAS